MASTFSNTEWEANSESDLEDADEVFSKLSRSYLITLYQDLMDRCQEKARHIKLIKK